MTNDAGESGESAGGNRQGERAERIMTRRKKRTA